MGVVILRYSKHRRKGLTQQVFDKLRLTVRFENVMTHLSLH